MSGKVHLESDGDVAIIVIDNPPINAGSAAVRQGLSAAIPAIAADPDVKTTVMIGTGKSFIAGSDLREFGQPLSEPQVPSIIAATEHCSKPVVAALHCTALRSVAAMNWRLAVMRGLPVQRRSLVCLR